MAIYHCSVKNISRGSGRSSVAAAAYRSGQKLENERDGQTHDYTKKTGVEYSEIAIPKNAPEWLKEAEQKINEIDMRKTDDPAIKEANIIERSKLQRDMREKLWNEVEKIEKDKDARTAREIEVAVPRELNREQQLELAKEYAKEFTDQGMVVDWSLHNPKDDPKNIEKEVAIGENDIDKNPHVHFLLTTREFDKDGNWGPKAKKEYILDKDGNKQYNKEKKTYKCRKVEPNDWNKKETLEKWRVAWEKVANRHLERAGHDARIDHRSNQERGIDREPQIHEGSIARKIEERGKRLGIDVTADRCDKNRKIKELNAEQENIKRLEKIMKNLDRALKKLEKAPEQQTYKKVKVVHIRELLNKEKAVLTEGITAQEAKLKKAEGKMVGTEDRYRIAVNRYLSKTLGKDHFDEKKRLSEQQKQLDKDKIKHTDRLNDFDRRLSKVSALDLSTQWKFKKERDQILQEGKGLENRHIVLTKAQTQLEQAELQKLADPKAEKKIQNIEAAIERGGGTQAGKVAEIKNNLEEMKTKVKEIDETLTITGGVADKLKNVEITIKFNIKQTGREILYSLVKNRAALGRAAQKALSNLPSGAEQSRKKPRGHTQARIGDDDDPIKKRGQGLGE